MLTSEYEMSHFDPSLEMADCTLLDSGFHQRGKAVLADGESGP